MVQDRNRGRCRFPRGYYLISTMYVGAEIETAHRDNVYCAVKIPLLINFSIIYLSHTLIVGIIITRKTASTRYWRTPLSRLSEIIQLVMIKPRPRL